MKRFLLTAWLVLGTVSQAFAAVCPEGLALKKVGTPGNATESMASSGVDVYAIGWQCTSTACTFGLYDGSDTVGVNANVAEGRVQFEAGAVASGGGFVDLTRSPIFFLNGVGMVTSGANVAGAIVYGCVQR